MLWKPGNLPFFRRFQVTGLRHLHSAPQTFSFTGWKHFHASKVVFNRIEQHNLHTAMQRPLNWYAGPLVWIDCEMTGLNPRKDRILEIAVRTKLHPC